MSNLNDPVKLFSELLGGPLGELISSVGKGVGEAQAALDHGALMQTLDLYDLSKDELRSADELKLINLVRGMGYQPTFYAIPETEVEAQISLSLDIKPAQTSAVAGVPLSKYAINATPLNAGNVNRFGLQSNAMAKLKFKIVPVPPNSGVAELRVVPDLTTKFWSEENRQLLQNLGFSYELRDVNNVLITNIELVNEDDVILSQTPAAGNVVNLNTPLVLTLDLALLTVPDLTGMMLSEEALELINNSGFYYQLRDVDGQPTTYQEADSYPIVGQSPEAGSIAGSNNPIIVTVDLNAF
ncbi:PASTA domain protein [compost metagenome]